MSKPKTLGVTRIVCLLVLAISSSFWFACGDSKEKAKSKIDLVGVGDVAVPKYGAKEVSESRPSSVNSGVSRGGLIAIDLIQDHLFRFRRDGWSLTTSEAQVNIDKLERGSVGFVLSAFRVESGGTASIESGLKDIRKLIEGTNGRVRLVNSYIAAQALIRSGDSIPMMVLLEGAKPLEGNLDKLVELKRQGLLVIGMVAGKGNGFADAAVSPRSHGGVTKLGEKLLAAAADAEIVIDLTHVSYRAFWDVLTGYDSPVIVSHTAARGLRDHARNLDDLQIIGLERCGGVAGIVFNPDFLRSGDEGASLSDVVEHIMYFRKLGAVGAIALGTDFDGIHPPSGLEDVSKLTVLADMLRSEGVEEVEIVNIFSKNADRVLSSVERRIGSVVASGDDRLRPIQVDCDVVIGEFEGKAESVCNRSVTDQGVVLQPSSKQKIRLREMERSPYKLELYGEPGIPWQIEAQNLDGKVLANRTIILGDDGRGGADLPPRRNLARVFCSPTRPSSLSEVVVWGR